MTGKTKCERVIKVKEQTRTPEEKKQQKRYPKNDIRNQKYTWWSFLPLAMFEQFKTFTNVFFLTEGLLKLVPRLKVGYASTSIIPLLLVMSVSIGREGYEDYMRYRRDKEINAQEYTVYRDGAKIVITSGEISVGDLVWLEKNSRVPADLVLLKTAEKTGSTFIKTDQLDGETDWKLRVSVSETQKKKSEEEILSLSPVITAELPQKEIHRFVGTIRMMTDSKEVLEPLDLENTLWMNTVLTGNLTLGCVVYTGNETRSQQNKTPNKSKNSRLSREMDKIVGVMVLFMILLSVFLTYIGTKGSFSEIYMLRFIMLLSGIIPLSLRVGIEISEQIQARSITVDKEIKNTIPRSRNLTEELGRVKYLLSDKTGTLTKNEMGLKKLCIGTLTYTPSNLNEIADVIAKGSSFPAKSEQDSKPRKKGLEKRLKEIVETLALCHNVVPSEEGGVVEYHAASPDEIAIVEWTASVGVQLVERTREKCSLLVDGTKNSFTVLHVFPFTSERKRMGIVVQSSETGEIVFLEKGADAIMSGFVKENNWLEEESENLAREGLRTLVFGSKKLSEKKYKEFDEAMHLARTSLTDRQSNISQTVSDYLEKDLELLAVTGVEDKLQDDLCLTLESLRNAGIKIWVLTGDKIETARCVAISSRLVLRDQVIETISEITEEKAAETVEYLEARKDSCLVIDGKSISVLLKKHRKRFLSTATQLSCVVACRCSPTQKAEITEQIREHTGKTVCCVGDGGNDVSMLHSSDVGIGIVGKEGMQASLAGDFSIEKFKYMKKLFLWHGRNSYTQSANVIHGIISRGIILSTAQLIYILCFYLAPIPLYKGMILIGYVSFYTSIPFLSILADYDASLEVVMLYPELYAELTKGRLVTFKNFFQWMSMAIYQGGIIVGLLFYLEKTIDIVSVSFTAVVLNAILTVALLIENRKLHVLATSLTSLTVYFASIVFIPEMKNSRGLFSYVTLLNIALATFTAFIPSLAFFAIKRIFFPETYQKL
ncbi:MAG: phospholipid-translocating P-type ATPase [Amphiamblys sp. WSBS2006]|nr:MAG: phospholipid-translocating P-type ATPase [Amphiamblys sp. WSBS2006]